MSSQRPDGWLATYWRPQSSTSGATTAPSPPPSSWLFSVSPSPTWHSPTNRQRCLADHHHRHHHRHHHHHHHHAAADFSNPGDAWSLRGLLVLLSFSSLQVHHHHHHSRILNIFVIKITNTIMISRSFPSQRCSSWWLRSVPDKPTSSQGGRWVIIIVDFRSTFYHHNAHHLNCRRMFHWTEDEYARLTTFTSLLSVFSSLVLLPILRSDISSFGNHEQTYCGLLGSILTPKKQILPFTLIPA